MRIVTLLENTTCREELQYKHGLSLYIETGNTRILFDAGQTGIFAHNAEILGVDLAKVDFAVLSHGHYDHGGGLACFLEINGTAPVYVHRDAFTPHYNGAEKYIGLDPALAENPRLIRTCGVTEIAPGITLLDCNDLPRPYGSDPFGLNAVKDGKLQPDSFGHEQYLLIREGEKTFLFSGCSHKGILNIAEWFHPDVLVGGFHFVKLDPVRDGPRLEAAAQSLLTHPTEYYTGHCTGAAAYAFLKDRMGQRLHSLQTGKVLVI